jgi:hypothetical protein
MTTTPSRISGMIDDNGVAACPPGATPRGYTAVDPTSASFPKSLVQDLRQVLDGSGTLIRQELQLVKAEAREQASKYAKAAAALGVGLAVLAGGMIVLLIGLAAAAYALLAAAGVDRTLAGWLGPVLVGVIVLVIGGVMVAAAKKKLMEPPTLKRAALEAERTAAWAKEKV